jgi:hypothetical protein
MIVLVPLTSLRATSVLVLGATVLAVLTDEAVIDIASHVASPVPKRVRRSGLAR